VTPWHSRFSLCPSFVTVHPTSYSTNGSLGVHHPALKIVDHVLHQPFDLGDLLHQFLLVTHDLHLSATEEGGTMQLTLIIWVEQCVQQFGLILQLARLGLKSDR